MVMMMAARDAADGRKQKMRTDREYKGSIGIWMEPMNDVRDVLTGLNRALVADCTAAARAFLYAIGRSVSTARSRFPFVVT